MNRRLRADAKRRAYEAYIEFLSTNDGPTLPWWARWVFATATAGLFLRAVFEAGYMAGMNDG